MIYLPAMNREIPSSVKLGAAVLGIAGTAFASGIAVGECNANNEYASQAHTFLVEAPTPGPNPYLPPIECEVTTLQEDLESRDSNPDRREVVTDYLSAQYFYESINSSVVGSDGQIFLNGNPQGAMEIKRKARDHVANGLCLIENIPSTAEKFSVNGDAVIYNKNTYDLNNTIDFNIVAGLVKLELAFAENNYYGYQKNIESLLSLREIPFTMSVESDAFPIIATEHLVKLSEMQHLINRIGLPPVDSIVFKGFRDGDYGGGWYSYDAATNTSAITVTNFSTPSSTMAHEFGHHVAQMNDRNGSNLGLNAFAKLYKNLRTQEQLTNSFSTLHQEEGSFVINPSEEYAEVFKEYVTGVLEVDSGLSSNPNLSKEEFKFFKKVLRGLEFSEGMEIERVNKSNISKGNIYSLLNIDHTSVLKFYQPELATNKPSYYGLNTSIISEFIVLAGPKTIRNADGVDVAMWQIGHTNTTDGKLDPMGWVEPEVLVNVK